MVISDQHKYVFVELPFTASTAISRELRENYSGQKILKKHASYSEFLKVASPEQKQYFVFAGIRNPLDETVSRYVKFLTDHGGQYSNPQPWVTNRHRQMYEWVRRREATFEDYLLRFFRAPYENWASLDHRRMHFVYRLENVESDFARILSIIGIEQVRPLPVKHQTEGKKDWRSYYTPRSRRRAHFVFGPFMNEWGYEFPEEWELGPVSVRARAVYRAKVLGKNYVRRLRLRESF